MMRAISLWQPYASLWLTPSKLHETRHWSTEYRGPLVVHAAKRLITDCGPEVDAICMGQFGPHWRRELPRGALIGIVNLVDCEATQNIYPIQSSCDDYLCGNFEHGRYGWRRGPAPRLILPPIPFIGRQGFFHVPDDVLRAAA